MSDDIGQPARDRRLTGIAEHATDGAGREAEQHEFPTEQREQPALLRAEAAHHGVAVQMALGVAARGQRNRDRGENHREHGREAEKLLRAVQPRAHLGTGVAQAFDALPGTQFRLGPGLVGVGAARARDVELIVRAAAGLDQPRGGQVVQVQQQARRDIEKAHTAIRFQGQHRAHRQVRVAKFDSLATSTPSAALRRSSSQTSLAPESRRSRHPRHAGAGRRAACRARGSPRSPP